MPMIWNLADLPAYAAAILLEDGLQANCRKTRIMPLGMRQHLTGLVVNERLNIARSEFDRLKAILTNCAGLGPAIQNRDDHPDFRAYLEGRVGFFESINPQKTTRLRNILKQICWPEPI